MDDYDIDPSEYPTVAEAAEALTAARHSLSQTWQMMRRNMDAGVMPPLDVQAGWNAVVYRQIGMELELLATIAENDPNATFDGKSYEDAQDSIRRSMPIGDFDGVQRNDGALGALPVLLIGLIVVAASATILGAIYLWKWTDVARHRAQVESAKALAETTQACLTAGNSAADCGRAINVDPYRPPPPVPEQIPGWAKGLAVATGALAVAGLVAVFVVPKIQAARALPLGGKGRGCVRADLSNTALSVWEERDRLHVGLVRKSDEQDIFDAWDDDARELFEDGFLDNRRLHESAYEYAKHIGLVC